MGNEVAACTRDTITGEGERSVITQAEETPFIQVPMLDASAANQKARNSGTLSGPYMPACELPETASPAFLFIMKSGFEGRCFLEEARVSYRISIGFSQLED
jgi:hypothetical protein